MTVYVITATVDFEGTDIVGVVSDEDNAKALVEKLTGMNDIGFYGEYDYYPYEVDDLCFLLESEKPVTLWSIAYNLFSRDHLYARQLLTQEITHEMRKVNVDETCSYIYVRATNKRDAKRLGGAVLKNRGYNVTVPQ